MGDPAQRTPDDYVLANGETHIVREFCERAFAVVGRRIRWQGEGVDEVGTDEASGKVLIRVDPRYFRPTKMDVLLRGASKACAKLGGKHRVSFDELVEQMVRSDLEASRAIRMD